LGSGDIESFRRWDREGPSGKGHAQGGRIGGLARNLLHLYQPRILAFDVAAARIGGALSDLARGRGAVPGSPTS
jgi:hypothetical protein